MERNMEQQLSDFPDHIRFAIEHFHFDGSIKEVDHLVFCGLGGSGIAGAIVSTYFAGSFPLPIVQVADYHLPAFVNKRSLVVLCSFSGDTEETLSMYHEAVDREAKMLVITTGGKLKRLAEQGSVPVLPCLPGNQPRMALGFGLTYLYLLVSKLLDQEEKPRLKMLAEKFRMSEGFRSRARLLVEQMKLQSGSRFVIVTEGLLKGVGRRFCQQLNENAKCEAFLSVLPEANHNEIESYYAQTGNIYLLLNSNKNQRVNKRFGFIKELLEKNGETVLDIPVLDAGIDEIMGLIYLLDWVSLEIADIKNVDPSAIKNIAGLKGFLE